MDLSWSYTPLLCLFFLTAALHDNSCQERHRLLLLWGNQGGILFVAVPGYEYGQLKMYLIIKQIITKIINIFIIFWIRRLVKRDVWKSKKPLHLWMEGVVPNRRVTRVGPHMNEPSVWRQSPGVVVRFCYSSSGGQRVGKKKKGVWALSPWAHVCRGQSHSRRSLATRLGRI